MLVQPYKLYIERTDTMKNMARFYALSIELTLFGTPCLSRRWGRIGKYGQMRVQHFDREEDAVVAFLELLRNKRARGYRAKPDRQQARSGISTEELEAKLCPMASAAPVPLDQE